MRTRTGAAALSATLLAMTGLALTGLAMTGCGPSARGHGSAQVRFSALLAAASATSTAANRDRAMAAVCAKVATPIEIENAVLPRADLWTAWTAPGRDRVYCPYSTQGLTAPADLTLTVRLVTGEPRRVDRRTPTSRVAIRDGIEVTATSPTGLLDLASSRLRRLLDTAAVSIRAG